MPAGCSVGWRIDETCSRDTVRVIELDKNTDLEDISVSSGVNAVGVNEIVQEQCRNLRKKLKLDPQKTF